ncbi:Ubiquinol-cytochrome c r [Paramicrosporidium saccamoebae]|uniref:Cytochrome b-c1 complex subunit Rieske, mitochondrial n=1 Tax=Paramicrosporidium saccamoebae TaxID=1246581 RepID=A0A2H9TMC8_9FUNG|nr:Ubiquinol-cytochrome c r [Paramicrosporidium saccamoebae]
MLAGRIGPTSSSLSTRLTSSIACALPLNRFPNCMPPVTLARHDIFAYDQDSNGPHDHVSHAPATKIASYLSAGRKSTLLSYPGQQRRWASKFTVTDSRDALYASPDITAVQRNNTDGETNRAFSYFMVGATGVLGAMGAKSTVLNFLTSWSASSEALAMAQVEVDLSNIPEGKSVVIKWRGKPIFIRHRTSGEVEEAAGVSMAELRDPQSDADRTQKPEWIVMLGICTHLGCVPLANSGDYNGWYCPCQYPPFFTIDLVADRIMTLAAGLGRVLLHPIWKFRPTSSMVKTVLSLDRGRLRINSVWLGWCD